MDNNEELMTGEQIAPTIGVTPEITGDTSAEHKSHKRILQGKVRSNKADKTIIVDIVRQVIHPLYKKYFRRTKRVMAHDPVNTCNPGDVVKIKECRPLSARKRWILVEVVERAK